MKNLQTAGSPALTQEQRALVNNNIGLVGVHLRRVVSPRARCTNTRNRDDLFQEGCLGLIRAARSYEAGSGIPFPSYALARIRSAVHEALIVDGEIPRHTRRAKNDPARRETGDPADRPPGRGRRSPRPRTRSLDRPSGSSRDEDVWIDRRVRIDEGGPPTIGDRMREKYERAAGHAAATLARRTCGRDDRADLVKVLLRERFLVPERSARRPLREIARNTSSSYGRVANAERRLRGLVCGQLESDPEFRHLRALRRKSADGARQIVDEPLDAQLRERGAAEFVRRLCAADATAQATLIAALLRCGGEAMERWARDRFFGLSEVDREKVLNASLDDGVAEQEAEG